MHKKSVNKIDLLTFELDKYHSKYKFYRNEINIIKKDRKKILAKYDKSQKNIIKFKKSKNLLTSTLKETRDDLKETRDDLKETNIILNNIRDELIETKCVLKEEINLLSSQLKFYTSESQYEQADIIQLPEDKPSGV
jgi:septal ring factor EnvC (AmiA/AmiB activator)